MSIFTPFDVAVAPGMNMSPVPIAGSFTAVTVPTSVSPAGTGCANFAQSRPSPYLNAGAFSVCFAGMLALPSALLVAATVYFGFDTSYTLHSAALAASQLLGGTN